MSDGNFDFGPVVFQKEGNPHDGKRYGFIFDSERAIIFGKWNEDGAYRNAPGEVAEAMNREHGPEIVQKKCAFMVANYENDVDITDDYLEDVNNKEQLQADGVVTMGYDNGGPNGGRWIDANTLSPIISIVTRSYDTKFGEVIKFINTRFEE